MLEVRLHTLSARGSTATYPYAVERSQIAKGGKISSQRTFISTNIMLDLGFFYGTLGSAGLDSWIHRQVAIPVSATPLLVARRRPRQKQMTKLCLAEASRTQAAIGLGQEGNLNDRGAYPVPRELHFLWLESKNDSNSKPGLMRQIDRLQDRPTVFIVCHIH